MATLSKSWSAVTQIEGDDDGFTTLVTQTMEYSDSVDLVTSGYDGSHVMVNIAYEATPEDQVKITVYGSLDGTNWDDTPLYQLQGNAAASAHEQISFIVRDLAYFRLGFQQTGNSDSNTVQAYVRNWNYGSTT